MTWKEDKTRIIDRSSNIFYHIAIATMILCYFATILFSFDILSFIGTAAFVMLLLAVWVVVAVIGCVTFLLALDGYRAFLMSLGKFILSMFNTDNTALISNAIAKISHYYPILAVLPPIMIALTLILKGVNKNLKNSKHEIITLSIMGILYIVSLVLSIILISGFDEV